MTGDGTNDAPALAQADVGVAMNTGTMAAKEAGNMVDLDSNPTKLIEIVEIGKQLLMTRGALTTFSIANDVAKYFAIIPAMFVVAYPGARTASTSCGCTPPHSAILSAVIFNALIIVALIPLALRGVKFRAIPAAALLRHNLLVYGLGGRHRAVHRHQAHRPDPRRLWVSRAEEAIVRRHLDTAIRMTILTTVLLGLVYPLAITGLAQVVFPGAADGSLIKVDGRVVGSALHRAAVLAGPSTSIRGPRRPATATTPSRRRPRTSGPTSQALIDRVKADVQAAVKAQPRPRAAAPFPSTWSPPRPAASTRTSPSPTREPRWRRVAAGPRHDQGRRARAHRRAHSPAGVRLPRRAARQRAAS